jgi:hypothetical protein
VAPSDADHGRDEAVVSFAVNVGGSRMTDERTPREASAACAPAIRRAVAKPGSGASRSVPTRPGASPSVQDAMTRGRSESWS